MPKHHQIAYRGGLTHSVQATVSKWSVYGFTGDQHSQEVAFK